MNLLEWHEARAGDTFFVPAGTVHAIGGGLVLCEIQQNSDVTYRLYDYGRPRELHLDHAVQVSRRGRHAARIEARDGLLASCAHFTTRKVHLSGTLQHRPETGAGEWWIVLEGLLEIGGRAARAGEVYHVPAGHPAFEFRGEAALLRSSAPA